MDLSHLSDAELEKLAGPSDHETAVAGMSDEDLQKIVSGQPPEPKYNAAQSAAMHGINTATGGFSDELQGLGEAAGRVIGVQGAGGPMKDMGIAPHGPTLDWETLRDAYRAARDHEREVLKQQEKEHPVASGAGDVVGSVVSPINKAVKGMSLAKAGAVLGGVNSLGSTEKEDLPGMAQDVAMGTGTGMLMGKTLSKLGGGAKNAIEDMATAPLVAPAESAAVEAAAPLEKAVYDPFTKQALNKTISLPQGPVSPKFDPFTKEAIEPIAESSPSLITRAMQTAHGIGAKGNELLDKLTPGSDNPLMKAAGRLGRYGIAGKIQAPLDAMEHGPEAAQWAAGKMSGGIDKAQDFLLKNPRLQELAQNSPKAFSALVSDFGRKVGAPASNVAGPNQAPVDDEKARQAFLSGN